MKGGYMEEILVPIIAIAFGCSIAIFGIIYSYLEKKKKYEIMAKLIEAGKSPEEIKQIFDIKTKKPFDPYSDLKKGIITTSIGIGFFAFGLVLKKEALSGIALFILILGIAFLLIHFLLKNKYQN